MSYMRWRMEGVPYGKCGQQLKSCGKEPYGDYYRIETGWLKSQLDFEVSLFYHFILHREDSSDCGGLRSLRSLRPLPTYLAWSIGVRGKSMCFDSCITLNSSDTAFDDCASRTPTALLHVQWSLSDRQYKKSQICWLTVPKNGAKPR